MTNSKSVGVAQQGDRPRLLIEQEKLIPRGLIDGLATVARLAHLHRENSLWQCESSRPDARTIDGRQRCGWSRHRELDPEQFVRLSVSGPVNVVPDVHA